MPKRVPAKKVPLRKPRHNYPPYVPVKTPVEKRV